MATDVFSPVTVFWGQLYHLLVCITLGPGTLQDPFLLFTFSLLILYEAEEDTGLSLDLHHQLGHLLVYLLPAILQQPRFFAELAFTGWSAFCFSLCWHRTWCWQKKGWEGIGLEQLIWVGLGDRGPAVLIASLARGGSAVKVKTQESGSFLLGTAFKVRSNTPVQSFWAVLQLLY